jgi:HEAT repeat protein
MMVDIDIKPKALDALNVINQAIKNVRLYPPTSATITNTLEKLHLIFLDIFEQYAPIIFSESEKNMLICGKPLGQKDQERLSVTTFLNILIDFGIRSISFDKGLGKAELSAFMDLLSKKPEILRNEGDLPKIMAEKNISHIYLDQKVYVSIDKDQELGSSLDINDDQVVQFIMSAYPESAADSQKLQEMFKDKDPEWISQTFQAGLSQLAAQEGTSSSAQLSEKLQNMLALLDKVTATLDQKDQDNISQHIGETIVTSDLTQELTTQTMEQLFGGVLLQFLIGKLEDIKYAEVQKTGEVGTTNGQGEAGTGETGRGQGDGGIDISGEGETQSDADSQKRTDFKPNFLQASEKLSLSLKNNENALLDESLMSLLPKIIEQLIAKKEQETMEKVINNLLDNLFSENAEVRASAAKALTDIIEGLLPERKTEMIESVTGLLIEWIKIETSLTPAYKIICNYLQNSMQDSIRKLRFAEIIPIMDVFNDIHSRILEKNDEIRDVSSEIIQNLASEEYLSILFKEIHTDERNKRDEASQILVKFGDVILDRLLDIVQEVSDSKERINVMHLIINMGQKAIPAIKDQINNKNAAWYYLRNMAFLLGHIGNETNAYLLQPLLLHKNERVRSEALKSIFQIGGKKRGSLLLSVLPDADDQFKLNIIETLGNAKCAEAVPNLLDLLKKRSLIASQSQNDLQEKICIALGLIGSPEAIPALSEIAESKSFFRIRTYPEKVKQAADRALESIRRKQK